MDSKTKSVLIVEDEKNVRELLIDKFKDAGFKVFSASDGKEALMSVKTTVPDVILLDLYMPVMDGETFLHNLRTDKRTEEVPVIVLSNWVGHGFVVNAFDKHVVDYLLKTNVGMEVIVQKVKSVVGL